MTPSEEIRAGLVEPLELLRSKSGAWHLLNERLGDNRAQTRCHPLPRIVMLGKVVKVTGLDLVHWSDPLPQWNAGGHSCRQCPWVEAAFGTAWPVVVSECLQRASTGIRNNDRPSLATEWGIPVHTFLGVDTGKVLDHLCYRKILRWEHGPYGQGTPGHDSYYDGTWYQAEVS